MAGQNNFRFFRELIFAQKNPTGVFSEKFGFCRNYLVGNMVKPVFYLTFLTKFNNFFDNLA